MSLSITTSSQAQAPKSLEHKRAEAAHRVISEQMQVLFQNINQEQDSENQFHSLALGASVFMSASNKIFAPEVETQLPKFREVIPSEFVRLYDQASAINDEFFRIAKAAREFRVGFNIKEDPNLDKFKLKIETLIADNNKNVDAFINIKEALQKALQSLKDDIDHLNEKEFATDLKKHVATVLKIEPKSIEAHEKIAQEENQERTILNNKITNIIDTITTNASRTHTSGSRYQIWRLTEGYKQGGIGAAMNNETLFALGTYWYNPKYINTKFAETKSVETDTVEPAKSEEKPDIKAEIRTEPTQSLNSELEINPTFDGEIPIFPVEEKTFEINNQETKEEAKAVENKKEEFPPLSSFRPEKPNKKKLRSGTDG